MSKPKTKMMDVRDVARLMGSRQPQTNKMHEAALRALANYQSSGEPFSLFLSSWSFDEKRKRFLSFLKEVGVRKEAPGNVQVRIGLERQVRVVLKKMADLETVAVYRKGDHMRIAMPEEWPALTLANEDWRARVTEIAVWADLIVLFWGVTTPGLAEELEICSSGSNPLKTVVVLPATPTEIFLSQISKSFPRVVPLSEIPPFYPLHSEFSPLIDRMKAIKSIDPRIRSGFVDPKKRLKKFPLPPTSGRFEGNIWIE